VLLGYRLGGDAVWVVADPARGTAAVDDVAAAELLLAALGAPDGAGCASSAAGGAVPAGPDPGVVACALAVARPVLAARRAAGVGGVGPRPRSAAAQAAHRLQARLAAVPGGPDPDVCARADAVLDALGRSLDAGTEAVLRETLARHGRAAPAGDGGGAAAEALALIEALEGVVGLRSGGGLPGARPGPGTAETRRRRSRTGITSAPPVLIGILEFTAIGR